MHIVTRFDTLGALLGLQNKKEGRQVDKAACLPHMIGTALVHAWSPLALVLCFGRVTIY